MNIPSIGNPVPRNPGIRTRSLGVMTGMLAVVILSSPVFAEVILVAGATGRLGSQIVREVAESGYQVRGWPRDLESARRTLGEQYEWIEGDIRDAQSIRAAIGDVDWLTW